MQCPLLFPLAIKNHEIYVPQKIKQFPGEAFYPLLYLSATACALAASHIAVVAVFCAVADAVVASLIDAPDVVVAAAIAVAADVALSALLSN